MTRPASLAFAALLAAGAGAQPVYEVQEVSRENSYFRIGEGRVLATFNHYWTPSGGHLPIPLPAGYIGAEHRGGMSQSGLITGIAQRGSGQNSHVFRFDPRTGESEALGQDFFTAGAEGHGIADNGVMVGVQRDYNDRARAWRYRDGPGFEFLPELRPGDGSEALHVNSSGMAAGQSWDFSNGGFDQQGVVWAPDGTVSAIPRLPGAFQMDCTDITESGWVAGNAVGDGPIRSWLRDPSDGSLFVVPHPERQDFGRYGLRVNERLEGVGRAGDTGGERGFYWSQATGSRWLQDLLAPEFQGYRIGTAWDINEDGQVLATALEGGQYVSVILNPVPEPSLLAGLGLGLAALARRRRKAA